MVHLFPAEMKPAIDLVRKERDSISPEVAQRSRTIVKIRNSAIALGLGLVIWLPIAVAMQSPRQFVSTLVAYVVLWGILAALTWYIVGQTRYHAMEVLEEIAERHPDEVRPLSRLLTVRWYALPFGPWYKPMYLPAFARRWVQRIGKAVIPG
jgi:hypothetical protein